MRFESAAESIGRKLPKVRHAEEHLQKGVWWSACLVPTLRIALTLCAALADRRSL